MQKEQLEDLRRVGQWKSLSLVGITTDLLDFLTSATLVLSSVSDWVDCMLETWSSGILDTEWSGIKDDWLSTDLGIECSSEGVKNDRSIIEKGTTRLGWVSTRMLEKRKHSSWKTTFL